MGGRDYKWREAATAGVVVVVVVDVAPGQGKGGEPKGETASPTGQVRRRTAKIQEPLGQPLFLRREGATASTDVLRVLPRQCPLFQVPTPLSLPTAMPEGSRKGRLACRMSKMRK